MQDSITEWKEQVRLLCIEKQKLTDKINDLQFKIANFKKSELIITNHALDRFQERIMTLPRQRVKSLLTDARLLTKYERRGPGKYQLKDMPDCICVVKDYTIVTVYSKNDPIEKLKVLQQWINYCIDKEFDNTPKFRDYRKRYYK